MNHVPLLEQIGRVFVTYGKSPIVVGDEDHSRVVLPFLCGAYFRGGNRVHQPAVRLRRTGDDLSDLLWFRAKRRTWNRVPLHSVNRLHSMAGSRRKNE